MRSCQPITIRKGATASTTMALSRSGGPLDFGRNEESACAIASFQNTILSSALNGNSTTRHTRMMMGMRYRFTHMARSSLHPLRDPIGDAQRIGDDRQRRVNGADRREKARIDHVKIVELVRLAVEVEHGSLWIGAEARGAGLVRGAADRDVLAEVLRPPQRVRMRAHRFQQRFEFRL